MRISDQFHSKLKCYNVQSSNYPKSPFFALNWLLHISKNSVHPCKLTVRTLKKELSVKYSQLYINTKQNECISYSLTTLKFLRRGSRRVGYFQFFLLQEIKILLKTIGCTQKVYKRNT
jgi:hypothetical protein